MSVLIAKCDLEYDLCINSQVCSHDWLNGQLSSISFNMYGYTDNKAWLLLFLAITSVLLQRGDAWPVRPPPQTSNQWGPE